MNDVPKDWRQVPLRNLLIALGRTDNLADYYTAIAGIPINQLKVSELKLLAFSHHLPKVEPVTDLTFVDTKYVVTEWGEITLGQMMDIERFSRLYDDYRIIPYLIAVLYHKEDEKTYEDYAHHIGTRSKMFYELDAVTALGVHAFFLLLLNITRKNSLAFLEKVKTRAQRLEKEALHFLSSTDSTTLQINSLITTLSNIEKLHQKRT